VSRALVALATLLWAGATGAADDCAAKLQAPHALRADGDGYTITFVPRPAPLATGSHFALDIVVCPLSGGAPPKALRVDADMPAHRHGMNYRATVAAGDPGSYRAEGLLLHMPGRWRFIFDLSLDGRSVRLTREVEVP